MKITCSHCGLVVDKPTGAVNRARNAGLPVYCNKACFGLAHRVERTIEEKKKIKSDYDSKYRKRDAIKEKKRLWNKTPAGRAWQKRNRDQQKDRHLAYCQTAEYRKWKHEYDQKHCARKNYGEFWEAAIILNQIEKIILPERLEAKIQKGTYNKSIKRKREWNSRPRI